MSKYGYPFQKEQQQQKNKWGGRKLWEVMATSTSLMAVMADICIRTRQVVHMKYMQLYLSIIPP